MTTPNRFGPLVFALVVLLISCGARSASAQTPSVRLPRPSQKASVMQTIGITDLTITYSRPGVKGRKIWGDAPAAVAKGTATLDDQNTRLKNAPIVPYGHVWRTGANEATVFAITDDVLINGQKLRAGTYSLHTIPDKKEWTLIFNSDAGQWGSFFYDEKKDVLRVKIKPEKAKERQEWLIYSIPLVTANSAQVVIRWEKVSVPFTVQVPDVEALVRARIDAAIKANPTEWRIPLSVANSYASEDRFDEALRWVEQSIKLKETFQNLSAKATFLFNSGKKEEGIALAEHALELGKADKLDTSRFEKRVADWKSRK